MCFQMSNGGKREKENISEKKKKAENGGRHMIEY